MNYSINSKVYRLKISNSDINVTVDDSILCENTDRAAQPDSNVKLMHHHAIYEFFFVENEPLTVFSDTGSISYKNCIVCIPPFYNHFSIRKNDCRILFSFNSTDAKKTDFFRFMNKISESGKPIKLKSNDNIIFLTKRFYEITNANNSFADEAAICALKLLFYDIFDLNYDKKIIINSDNSNSSYLVKIDSMLADFQKDIKLKTVADVLGLSTKQTSRIIRKNYKLSLSELIREKRLRAACTLLSGSSMSVSEIVEYINFPSESSFYNRFKKTYGLTPLSYRKKHQP